MSRRKRRHFKSPTSLTASSASRSHNGCLLHQGILLTPIPCNMLRPTLVSYLMALTRKNEPKNAKARLSYIGSQVKRRQSQSYKFKEFDKISIFCILKQPLHATHLVKLLDKMCKYEMDPMSIVENTERTRFCPQTDRRTDGQCETNILPLSTSLKRGV